MDPGLAEFLRRLANHDESVTVDILSTELAADRRDQRTAALECTAALIAHGTGPATLQWAVDRTLATGATDEDIIDILIAVAPVVGLARVTAAAAEVALALGYDVEECAEP